MEIHKTIDKRNVKNLKEKTKFMIILNWCQVLKIKYSSKKRSVGRRTASYQMRCRRRASAVDGRITLRVKIAANICQPPGDTLALLSFVH